MTQFTHEERLDIVQNYLAASGAGKDEEAQKIIRQLPLAPHLAKAGKEIFGIEYIKNSGFDLSEAEARYGKNWLDR